MQLTPAPRARHTAVFEAPTPESFKKPDWLDRSLIPVRVQSALGFLPEDDPNVNAIELLN